MDLGVIFYIQIGHCSVGLIFSCRMWPVWTLTRQSWPSLWTSGSNCLDCH